MTNHRALPTLFAPTACLLAAAAILAAAPAAAQDTHCQPGDLFCAELRIGPGRAGVRIGGGQEAPPPPPPQVVVEEPQPPVVVVQPMPPPPPPQQPPMVVVQPAYPQYQPPPPPRAVYVRPVQRRVVQRDRFPYSSMGVHLHLDGLAGQDLAMAGAGAGFRLRPVPALALDIGGGVYGGNDYNGLDRVEVPISVTGRIFFNPQHRFQFYGLLQVGTSFSHAEGQNVHTGDFVDRDYVHLGGAAGFGVEWRISRSFALNLDMRGFLRGRVDENSEPEFTELRDGTWQSTDLSGGFVGQFGMTFYWGT